MEGEWVGEPLVVVTTIPEHDVASHKVSVGSGRYPTSIRVGVRDLKGGVRDNLELVVVEEHIITTSAITTESHCGKTRSKNGSRWLDGLRGGRSFTGEAKAGVK